MKQISDEQIAVILDAFYKANAGVQIYAGVKEMFEQMPLVEKVEDKKEE